MPEETAIVLDRVIKHYRLYDSVAEQALDVLGLSRVRFWKRPRFADFAALRDVSLTVRHGERLGIVGRNGAGKTTLLKLVTGNVAPTAGTVTVNGQVQALFRVGLGFHPEFTGLENIRAALAYNGLGSEDLERAVSDVTDFVELGDFLRRPMKTYSLGMQTRLMFAVATAVKPNILIVDEVLGAGDAYFSAKSAQRIQQLARSGCTLLLVSHSMQQVLQFCDTALWIEEGRVIMQDETLAVVKAYEEFMDGLYHGMPEAGECRRVPLVDQAWFRSEVLERVMHGVEAHRKSGGNASERVSRWSGIGGLRIDSARTIDQDGRETKLFRSGKEMRLEVIFVAEKAGRYPYRLGILLLGADGRPLCRHLGPAKEVSLEQGETHRVIMRYPSLLLGEGEYTLSVGTYRTFDPEAPNRAERYDLLARSCIFRVQGEYRDDPTLFRHPVEWYEESV